MQTLDQTRVEAFAGQIAVEIGAALNAALVTVGDELGLYRAMADAEPVSAGELAARTNTHERYVREWLNAQAAGGFVTYDSAEDRYTLPAEHAFILADESSPVAMAGIFQAATAVMDGRTRVTERFRSGEGVGWHEHHEDLRVHRDGGVVHRLGELHRLVERLRGLGADRAAGRQPHVRDEHVGASLGHRPRLLGVEDVRTRQGRPRYAVSGAHFECRGSGERMRGGAAIALVRLGCGW
jgi:hypothetical protein